MFRKLTLSVALAAGLLASGAAVAASSVINNPTDLPPVMTKLTQAGVKVLKEFPAIGKLNGWVLMHENQPAIAYTTPNGKAMLFGPLLSPSGENMTLVYTAKYAPKPNVDKLMGTLKKEGTIIVLGDKTSKHVIYTFEDPNCIFCHLTDIELKPYIQAGLQVRLIPVGFLKKSSAGKAAAILQSSNPTKAWEADEAGFNESEEEGAAVPIAHPKAKTVKELETNLRLMQKFGFNGTPGILYKDGKHWTAMNGMPKIAQLPAITGLPAQKETDPQLARFQ
jgi:thiol:disulfide interchange protein DsbG